MKELLSLIQETAALQIDQCRRWLKGPTAIRDIGLYVGIGLAALVVLLFVWKGVASFWIWYSAEVASKDGTPVYPHAALVNPVVAGIGAALLVVAALLQAATARRRHTEQTDADRQRRITESFGKAVEQLAHASAEVRVGGIFTLERISRESPGDYWTAMEVLTAFVREQARWKMLGIGDVQERPASRTDVAAALAVIRRRPEAERNRERTAGWRLDLSGTDLRGADLVEAHLEHAVLRDVHLENTLLWQVHLERADLQRVRFEGATLALAHLELALLHDAHLEGANLGKAHLEEAVLDGAHLEGATLWEAYLDGVHLEQAIGDEKTQLPDRFPRPAHWPRYKP